MTKLQKKVAQNYTVTWRPGLYDAKISALSTSVSLRSPFFWIAEAFLGFGFLSVFGCPIFFQDRWNKQHEK